MNSNFNYTSFSAETATTLRDHAQQITTRLKRAKEETHAIAESLADAQKLLSTIQFEDWCTSELNITGRHARRLIRTAKFFTDGIPPNVSQTVGGMITSENTPEAVREEVLADAKAGKKTSVQELNQKIAAHKAAAESGKPAQSVQPAPAPMKAANTNTSQTGSVAPALSTAPATAPKLTRAEKKTLKQEEDDARLLLKRDIAWLADLLQATLAPKDWDRARALLDNRLVVEIDPEHGGRALVRVMDRRRPKAQPAVEEMEEGAYVLEDIPEQVPLAA